MGTLSPELRAFLVSGLAGTIAVARADGGLAMARIWAARAGEGDVLEVFVQRSSGHEVIEALASPGRAAANLIDVPTYRSRSFKGVCALAPTDDQVDASFLEESLAAVEHAFQAVGMPGGSVERMLSHGSDPHAMAALRITVESVFDQSPKPGAGARI